MSNNDYPAYVAVGGGVLVLYYIIVIAVAVMLVVANWKIFVKAGEAGWKALIPFVSTWTYFKIATGSGARMFMTLIPFFGEVYAIIVMCKLCRAFGKSGGFCVGMIFLTPIFYMILGFDQSYYIGPNA